MTAATRATWRGAARGRALMFLDFDGVLHRAENGSSDFEPNLERLLTLVPDLDVVISSNWRINASRTPCSATSPRPVTTGLLA